MPSSAALLALLLLPAAVAGAQEPAAAPVGSEPLPPPAEAAAPAAGRGPPARWSVAGGWGYYEVTHVGASYHPGERSAVTLFGGWGVGPADQDASIGLAYSHAILRPRWGLEPGVAVKGIYWTQSDELYDWQNLSLVLGPALATDLGKGLRLALDAGVAFTFALESDRKQNFTFGSPTRWNGSVCLEISYRLGAR